MELRHLRYYVAVAEECHFGRAAARLHIAQPPLSQQVKQLEAELGVQLLVRSTRRVELTAAGEAFLDRARALLAGVEAAADEARRVAAGELGHLAIGFTGTATYELLPTLSRALRHELPGVGLDLRGEMLTPSQTEALLDGRLDIGLLRPPVGDADLTTRILREEPLIAVLPESHPLAGGTHVDVADLRNETLVGYPSRHRSVIHDAVVEACRGAGFTPRATEVAETSTLVSFVAAGLGVALVPRSVQHLRITGATYRPLTGSIPTVALAVATRRNEADPAVLRAVEIISRLVNQDF
ncbi:LysR substrate-binding domain-containing protein [Nocardioides sp. W7]|uniref:LysR substrate-binding domain-containing protein n=1 Tax=Nocardioides sp. W7 TaxID=2931390 RepID=UPI001FD1F02F|nr:LysR substrate-binding domain-containing protein [Nocardioides sp. W7]